MPAWLRRLLTILGLCALVALAYGPVVRAGIDADDHGLLVRAGAPVGQSSAVINALEPVGPPPLTSLTPGDLFAVEGGEGWFLSGLSLAVSRRLWGLPGADGVVPIGYRLENLFLLGLCAVGLHRFLRRMLMPWLGSEQAAAASRTAAALLFLHPLGAATIVSLNGRGDLLSFLFFIWTAAAFLRGRQDRKVPLTALAFGGTLLACLSGDLGLWLPLFLAFAEFVSSHRYRKRRDRLRTAGTTIIIYGGALVIAVFLRVFETGVGPVPGLNESLASVDNPIDAAQLALSAVEKLGVLILPVSSHGPGMFGTALAGLLFLFAMQPALVAARSAPRLWGWLLFCWFVALVIAGMNGLDTRVHPGHLGTSRILFGASAVMCVGLGVAVTAVSGLAAQLRPLILVVGFAVLARGNAVPWVAAGQWLTELRHDIMDARERHGRDADVLLVDPLESVHGIDPLRSRSNGLDWVLHPEFTGEHLSIPTSSKATTESGFLALAREPEFEQLRDKGLLVVFATDTYEENRVGPIRQSKLVTASVGNRGTRSWRRESRSPDLDLDSLSIGALQLSLTVGSELPTEALELGWRARYPLELELASKGAWWTDDPVAQATCDLSASLAWRLSGQVRRVWIETALSGIGEVELLNALPTLGSKVEPEALGDDWAFRLNPPESLARSISSTERGGRWVIGLLDLESLAFVEIAAKVKPSGTIHVQGAAGWVRDVVTTTGGPVAWLLEYRVNNVAVARSRGRRIGG
ncbi:MAG: hypothetical protein ACI8TQ_002222 [Planctomycetota bacterium]|jgi:hypothetical protein